MRIEVQRYLDYRAFLVKALEELREGASGKSFRSLAKAAGLSPPNFMQQVLAGKRKLNATHIAGLAKLLELDPQSAEYFRRLTAFGQAESFEEKESHYHWLLGARSPRGIRLADPSMDAYLTEWYHPVIREILVRAPLEGTAQWVRERITPSLPLPKVKASIAMLQKLGLAAPDRRNGRWELREPVVATSPEADSVAVAAYHRGMLRLAEEAVVAIPPEDRDIRGITLSLDREAYRRLKIRLYELWRETLKESETAVGGDRVYQLNLQLFPVSKNLASGSGAALDGKSDGPSHA